MMHKIMYWTARIFGRKFIGVDYSNKADKTATAECYIFRGKCYSKSDDDKQNRSLKEFK